MIEILERYGTAFLWSDGYHFTGVAVTMWLLVISVVSALAIYYTFVEVFQLMLPENRLF